MPNSACDRRRRRGRAALAALALAIAGHAAAESLVLQPRLTAGVIDYALRFDDAVSPNANGGHDFRDGFKVQDRVPFAGVGVSLIRGRFLADVSGQWSRRGHDHTEQVVNNSLGDLGVYTVGDGQNHRSDVSFDRHEYNLNLGWSLTSGLSVYGGYKNSRADLVQTLTPLLAPPPLLDAAGRDGDVLFNGDYRMRFSYQGAFAGVSFAVPVGRWGALALQTSLARLDGAFEQRFRGVIQVTNLNAPGQRRTISPAIKDGEVDGRSTGLNVGIAWSGNFGRGADASGGGWSYAIGVDHSRYKFDAGRSQESWASDFEEQVTRARLDLRYRFTVQ